MKRVPCETFEAFRRVFISKHVCPRFCEKPRLNEILPSAASKRFVCFTGDAFRRVRFCTFRTQMERVSDAFRGKKYLHGKALEMQVIQQQNTIDGENS